MKKLTLITLTVAALAVLGAATVQAGNKVQMCHVPTGNPANFHTIKVNENAVSAHLAHGDVGGACNDACATLCDDQDDCTIDDTGDCELNGCPTFPDLVDCDDTNECTIDTCDPVGGCVNTADTGAFCDDSAACTELDTCNENGGCAGIDIDNCCLDDTWCSPNPCDGESCDAMTNRCVGVPVECAPDDPQCQTSECNSTTGECDVIDFTNGTVCDDGNPDTVDDQCALGMCSGSCPPPSACPCWTSDELAALRQRDPSVSERYTCGNGVFPFGFGWNISSVDNSLEDDGTACYVDAIGIPGSATDDNSVCRYTAYVGTNRCFERRGRVICRCENRVGDDRTVIELTPEEGNACRADTKSSGEERDFTCL